MRLTAIGLPALMAGPAAWMPTVPSATVVLRAVMPTKSTAIEATTEIATILTWVFRSAAKIVELFIAAPFQRSSKKSVYSFRYVVSLFSGVSGRPGSKALNTR
jgi:hypothetical protein